MRLWLVAVLGLLVPAAAGAQSAPRPIVGELLTSYGCPACPRADEMITELARKRPNLPFLTPQGTYWNYLGRHDLHSMDAATARQQRYVSLGVSPEAFTSALIVDGKFEAIGSDGGTVKEAFQRATTTRKTVAPIAIKRSGSGLHRPHMGIGENGGRKLAEANIVRSLGGIGSWSGQPLLLSVLMAFLEGVAVLRQAENGPIIGAGRLGARGDSGA